MYNKTGSGYNTGLNHQADLRYNTGLSHSTDLSHNADLSHNTGAEFLCASTSIRLPVCS